MGIETRLFRMPDSVARAIGATWERFYRAFGRPKPLFTVANVKLCDIDHYFSIDKAKRHLEYAPLLNTEEGLRRTAVEAREYYDSL
jgi:nucleoside-diphosphate-sugar epimerase